MKQLNILLVTPYYMPLNYGGATVVYKTLIELSRHNISVLTNRLPEKFSECLEFDKSVSYTVYRSQAMVYSMRQGENIPVSIFKFGLHIIRQIINLIKAMLVAKPDVLLCGNVADIGWLIAISTYLCRKKIISYVHAEEVTTKAGTGLWASFLRYGCKKVLHKSEKIIVVSRFTKDILKERGFDAEKIEIITNGVDINKYFRVSKSQNLIRKYNLDGKKVILTVARLVPKKGIDVVIKSLPEIVARCPELIYLVVGSGVDRPRLERLAVENNVADNVIFAGFISDDEINNIINLADIFVMPNRAIDGDTEGFGLVFLEASACGVPVVGGVDGGTADAILDGITGFRIDGTDTTAITQRMIQLLNDENLRKQMGVDGYRWVHEQHRWDAKIKAFDEVIEESIS